MSETEIKSKTVVAKHKTARLTISAIILFITYCGITTIDIHSRSFWFFSQILSIVVCCLALWLYWYIFRHQRDTYRSTIWHQLLHWCGTLIAIYALTLFVSSGLLKANQAGIITCILLSFSLFIAGVYTDTVFILLGLSIGALTFCIGTIIRNVAIYNSGITLGAGLLIFAIAQYQQYITQKKSHEKK